MRAGAGEYLERNLSSDAILEALAGGPHIFNLGHGILPTTPVENARYLVECVKELSAANADRAQIA